MFAAERIFVCGSVCAVKIPRSCTGGVVKLLFGNQLAATNEMFCIVGGLHLYMRGVFILPDGGRSGLGA